MSARIEIPFEQHFMSKVIVRGKNDCWSWTGCHNSCQLPYYSFPKKYREDEKLLKRLGSESRNAITATRAIYAIYNNGVSYSDLVYHTCGNRRCVNPYHMQAGKKQDQANHRVRTGRQAHGKKINKSKLTPEDVLKIVTLLSNNQTVTKIARDFGVSPNTISFIRLGHTWSHISGIKHSGKFRKQECGEDQKKNAWFNVDNKDTRFV